MTAMRYTITARQKPFVMFYAQPGAALANPDLILPDIHTQ
jgi:hypothetical protein